MKGSGGEPRRSPRGRRRAVLLSLGVALGLGLLLGGVTRVPYRVAGGDEARLRLSWRLRADEAGPCLPPGDSGASGSAGDHMRNPDACLPTLSAFRLRVEVDGGPAIDARIRPSGLRGDRPLYVYREIRLAPGRHRVAISFTEDGAERGAEKGLADAEDADPGGSLRLTLDEEISFGPREIVVITFDEGAGRLRVRSTSEAEAWEISPRRSGEGSRRRAGEGDREIDRMRAGDAARESGGGPE